MLNEVLQWVALIVLTLLLLGVFRQFSESLPSIGQQPSVGLPRGARLPEVLASQLKRPHGEGYFERVAFITEGCMGCQRLLASLESATDEVKGSVFLVAERGSQQFHEALKELGVEYLWDDGQIAAECHASVTPLILKIDSKQRVLAKEVTTSVA